MTPEGTIDASQAASRQWPVAVVGAGPAGACAARELARRGLRVLLIDRGAWPRSKVCGGCLNGRTLSLLQNCGLDALPERLGGQPLDRFELRTRGRTARIPMPQGISVTRSAFDAALVSEAVTAGADFLPETRAVLGKAAATAREVWLPKSRLALSARVVLAADGLGGSFLPADSGRRSKAQPTSRIGAGAVLAGSPRGLSAGVIHMAVDRRGYVGLALAEGGQLSVAAALDRELLSAGRGVGEAVNRVLSGAGFPALDGGRAVWQGTSPLTRRSDSVAFERVFMIGDAAGYVEPFTGEGISWALEAALEVAPLAAAGAARWREDLAERWRQSYRGRIARRQRWCRGVAWALRRPRLVRAAVAFLDRTPSLATPLMAHLNAAPARRLS